MDAALTIDEVIRPVGAGRLSERDRAETTRVLPAGRRIVLPGRGETFVREIGGPPGATTLILLHGWGSTADLTWHRSYRDLGRHHRVVALDHRGHGRGLASERRFRLEDCADDVAALADVLGIDRFVPVGYSMGGPIASLTWRRHRERVDGLVLCATSAHFADTRSRRAMFGALGGMCALASTGPVRSLGALSRRAWSRRLERRGDETWMAEQVLRHDWAQFLAAGRAIGRYDARSWLASIDVPVGVVVTEQDDVVPRDAQLDLASALRDASTHRVPDGHMACSDTTGRFASAVLDACRSVIERTRADHGTATATAPAA